VDRIQIQQVMLNLIMNAVEAMEGLPPERRRLRLASRAAKKSNDNVHFLVSDSANGIPPERLKTIFEPFVTTKGEGLGMGLAISRGIVEDHGGAIWVESSSENGTTLAFQLPLATPSQGLT
jgi:C4-dicarboxylate-specific signal transduction histidine kinase